MKKNELKSQKKEDMIRNDTIAQYKWGRGSKKQKKSGTYNRTYLT